MSMKRLEASNKMPNEHKNCQFLFSQHKMAIIVCVYKIRSAYGSRNCMTILLQFTVDRMMGQ